MILVLLTTVESLGEVAMRSAHLSNNEINELNSIMQGLLFQILGFFIKVDFSNQPFLKSEVSYSSLQ